MLGVGAGLTLVVLLVLQSVTTNGVFGTRTETVTDTVTTTQQIADVGGSFAEHILLLDSKNVSAIVNQYQGNASVTWTGQAVGLAGTYEGARNISELQTVFFETFGTTFAIANVTRAITTTSSDSVMVNSTFGFSGFGRWGNDSGIISAQDHYSYSATNGAWLISRETWNFLTFVVEYPAG